MGEAAQSGSTGKPRPAAQLRQVWAKTYEKRGDYLIQEALYKDKVTGHARNYWQVVRKDGQPMPSGRPAEILGRKSQAMTLCLKLAGPIQKKTKKSRAKSVPIKTCELHCTACDAPYLENVYRGQHPDTMKPRLCHECWIKGENTKHMTKAREMGLPEFTSGSPDQIGYAFSVRQKFIDGIHGEPQRKEKAVGSSCIPRSHAERSQPARRALNPTAKIVGTRAFGSMLL